MTVEIEVEAVPWEVAWPKALDDYAAKAAEGMHPQERIWSTLTASDIDKLRSLHIETAGYGICDRCESPRKLHTNNISLYDDGSKKKLCWSCVKLLSFYNLNLELQVNHAGDRFDVGDMIRYLIDNDIAPRHEEQRDQCPSCREYPLSPNETSKSKYWGELIDWDGKQMYAHTKCINRCAGNKCSHWTFTQWSMTRVDGKFYCDDCFNTLESEHDIHACDYCGYRTIDEDNLEHSDLRDAYLCDNCYSGAWDCGECNSTIYGEDEDHDCEYDEDDDGGIIKSYSYKPRPVFFGSANYHMGIELEVEEQTASHDNRIEMAEYVQDALGNRVYIKSDGSLSYGFEIVTHPHSLDEYHTIDWSFLNVLAKNDIRSWQTSTCGLHVHVGIVAFKSRVHEARFTKFIYDNEKQIIRIAGRQSDYARFTDKGKSVHKIKNKNRGWDRYQAVNVNNRHTLEVRVFRGSLRKERLLSAIEFVHAVVEYTRDVRMVSKDMPFSWGRFVGYVSQHLDLYPNLFIIMNEQFSKGKQDIVDNGEDD